MIFKENRKAQCKLRKCQEMAYIQAYSLLSDPEYINFVYICVHANYLNKILFKLNIEKKINNMYVTSDLKIRTC